MEVEKIHDMPFAAEEPRSQWYNSGCRPENWGTEVGVAGMSLGPRV